MAVKSPENPREYREARERRSTPSSPEYAQVHENISEDDQRIVAEQIKQAERLAASAVVERDALLVRIEDVMSRRLADEFRVLSPAQRTVFKQKGEDLARWIHEGIAKDTLRIDPLLKRVLLWLRIIEDRDRNRYWILQEAYILTREIAKQFLTHTS